MTKAKSIALRFVKAFLSGFFSGIAVISLSNIHVWSDLTTALQVLGLAGTLGGLNGIILAGQKYFTWVDDATYQARLEANLKH